MIDKQKMRRDNKKEYALETVRFIAKHIAGKVRVNGETVNSVTDRVCAESTVRRKMQDERMHGQ